MTYTDPGPMEQARIAAGLTVPEVAARLARCTASVRRWERGHTTPSQAVMLKLADLYGCQPPELVDA